MESFSLLMAFWMGFSSVLLMLALLLAYKLFEFLKSTFSQLLDELKEP